MLRLKEKPNDNPWTVTAPLGLARNGQTNFKKIINNSFYKEKGFSIVFDENALMPVTGVIEDKTSYETLVTPQYLKINKKEVFSSNEWMPHKNDSQGDFLKWSCQIDDSFKRSMGRIDYILIGNCLY